MSKMTIVIAGARPYWDWSWQKEMEVEDGDTVSRVKQLVNEKFVSIEPADQILKCEEQTMKDNKTLAYYNIKEGTILYLRPKKSSA